MTPWGLLGLRPGAAHRQREVAVMLDAAKAAGVHAVAVTWGGIHSQERLAAEEPDAVVHTAEELLAAL